MREARYNNVWDAIEPDPAEAENLKLRSSLMLAKMAAAAGLPVTMRVKKAA